MQRIFVTGANRGLGLEFVKQYSTRDTMIFAACRNSRDAQELQTLAQHRPAQIKVIELDMDDDAEIAQSEERVREYADALDILINNAGSNPPDASFRQFGRLDANDIQKVIRVNAIAPLILTQTLAPLLHKGEHPRVIMVSSQMGSFDWVRASGGSYAYKMSKATMNMAARTLAGDLSSQGIITITMHPGWVQTDMGGRSASLTPEKSVSDTIKLIDGLKASDNGQFFKWNGEKHAW